MYEDTPSKSPFCGDAIGTTSIWMGVKDKTSAGRGIVDAIAPIPRKLNRVEVIS